MSRFEMLQMLFIMFHLERKKKESAISTQEFAIFAQKSDRFQLYE